MSTNYERFTIIHAHDRQTWNDSSVLSRQSFPATGNFNLLDSAYGTLLIHNDDIVSPGEGFDMHQHKDMEIISWIMEGKITHRDSQSMDTHTTLETFQAQAISAGTGVRHSEVNANSYTSGKKLRVIQMWIHPDKLGITPRHNEANFQALTEAPTPITFDVAIGTDGRVVDNPLAADAPAALEINATGTELQITRLAPGDTIELPAAAFVHAFLAAGNATLTPPTHPQAEEILTEGDVLRAENQPLQLQATGEEETLLITWYMTHTAH